MRRLCLVLAAAAAAAAVVVTERRPNNCTELIGENATRVHAEALTVNGAVRDLWLAWRGDADRVSVALLLRVLAALPRCRLLRCRLRLCHTPQGLRDLLQRPDTVGVDTAIAAGFETIARYGNNARDFHVVNNASQLPARDHAPPDCSAAVSPVAAPVLLAVELGALQMYAPWLVRAMAAYSPAPSDLCALLQREARLLAERGAPAPGEAAALAAAQWASAERDRFQSMVTEADGGLVATRYRALVYRCGGDETGDWTEPGYEAALAAFARALEDEARPQLVDVQFHSHLVDCLSTDEIRDHVQEQLREPGAHRLLGALGAGAGVPEAAALAARCGLAFLSYDTQRADDGAPSEAPDAAAAGAALHAQLAGCGWRRAALLSEDTPAARCAAEAFGSEEPVRRVTLPASDAALDATLAALRDEGARVFVLNVGGPAAARALAAAARVGLTPREGYAWVAREWTAPRAPPLALLALAPAAGTKPPVVARLWRSRPPARAAPLARAMRALALGYAEVFKRNETWRFDHRLRPARESFLRTSIMYPRGAHHLMAEEWLPHESEPRLRADVGTCPESAVAVQDDASSCRLPVGDPFAPRCLDAFAYSGALALPLGLALGAYCAMARRRRAARRARALRSEVLLQLLERQPGTRGRLKDALVERERVTLLRELGAGRYGRVSLAELAPGGARVAAKMPHADCALAEEGELVREAATLAPLRHAHVVRLVGVCIGPGAPLLLTPVARHGDLLAYLRARRRPAADEAAHVSAPALTRLAREAALALAYLQQRGVVHCDVRAANCLVDERRELKLADFGMARALGGGGGAAPERGGDEYYACRRRALFPVLWMAPESLARGAFSAASDVWALGVLTLELVTLGARPFGALSAAEAVALVTRGGHARLPTGATAETRELTRQCWRREARERPSARMLAAWLAARPAALAPVPLAARDADDAAAFGEVPAAAGTICSIEYSPDSL